MAELIKQELVLICGAPGSGKSTIAETMFCTHVRVEADDFFIDDDGVYRYDRSLIKQAHEECFRVTDRLLHAGCNVVVANTFTRQWEREPYLSLAKKHKLGVRYIHATGEYPNIHGVPDDVVLSMRQRFEPF